MLGSGDSRLHVYFNSMLLPIVSEQTLYKTRVDALCNARCLYAPRSYSQRVNDQKVSILLKIRIPDT